MTSKATRTLAVLALMIAASQATAQSMPYSMEYRWLTLFGDADQPVVGIPGQGMQPRTALDDVVKRAFVAFESDYRLAESAYTRADFRRPDPAFGSPAAFQRPRQVRLSFRVRF
jgi:hypothetical protein